MEPLRAAEVTDDPSEVDLHPGQRYTTVSLERGEHAGTLTFDSRVGFELLKLFMRYQMDFRILHMMRNIMISAAHKPSTVLKISAIEEAAEEDPSRDEVRSSLPPTRPLSLS